MEPFVFATLPPLAFALILGFATRRGGKRGMRIALIGWTIFVSLFAYMLFRRLDAEAERQGLQNAGIQLAAMFLWAWLALATPVIGALLLAGIRRWRQRTP